MARRNIMLAVNLLEHSNTASPNGQCFTICGFRWFASAETRPPSMILFPASAITGLSAEQLEAVLAHELAHVRRHDFLVNALQTIAETLLFYHPAIWWLSRHIRHEREHCCDDLAVSLCSPVEYCRALLALEQLRAPQSAWALGATDGSLVSRVRRIAGTDAPASGSHWSAVLLAGASVIAARSKAWPSIAAISSSIP